MIMIVAFPFWMLCGRDLMEESDGGTASDCIGWKGGWLLEMSVVWYSLGRLA